MMKKRKILALILAMSLVLSLSLTGCQSVSNSSNSSKNSNSSETKKLVVLFPGSTPKDLTEVNTALSNYVKDKINATVELRPIDWGNYKDKLNLMFASGEEFDVLWTASWQNYGDEVSSGKIIPLDSLVDQYGQGIKTVLDPAVVKGGEVNGKVYAVTTNKEFASAKGITMRKELVDKYKFDLTKIKTLADMTPILETIKKNEAGVTPLQVQKNDSPLTSIIGGELESVGESSGLEVLRRADKNTTVLNEIATPEYMNYAKLMHQWYQAGYINQDATTISDNNNVAVKNGKAFAYDISLKPGIESQEAKNTGTTMVTVQLTEPYQATGDTMSSMLAIPKNSKNPELAMKFINLMFTDKYVLNTVDFGLEGKDYVKKSEGIIDYPSGVTATTVPYNINSSWMFGNQMISYLWPDQPADLWKQYNEFNSKAEKSKALGFTFDPTKVSNEVTALSNVTAQYSPGIVTGAEDPEVQIPKYLDALKAAGIDKTIKEVQSQLDAWSKTNK